MDGMDGMNMSECRSILQLTTCLAARLALGPESFFHIKESGFTQV